MKYNNSASSKNRIIDHSFRKQFLYSLSLICAFILMSGCSEGDIGSLPPSTIITQPEIDDPVAYAADTLVVREILDSNGLKTLSVEPVTHVKNSRITFLDLSRQPNITTIPSVIGSLAELCTLNLNNILITSLPPSIGKLTKLNSFQINRTPIHGFPAAITRCTALTLIYCTGDSLESLPDSMGNLIALKTLEASNNQLTTLPASIRSLATLSIGVQGNRLCALDTATARWLDARAVEASGWRSSQKCQ